MAKTNLTPERRNEYMLSAVSTFTSWFFCNFIYFWDQTRYQRFKEILGMHVEELRSKIPSKPDSRSFPQFSLLPLEIRLQIWDATLPAPRALILRSPYSRSWKSKLPWDKPLRESWWTTTPIPVTLHINRESREFAKRYYKLALACGFYEARIYVNFDKDWITLGKDEMRPKCDKIWQHTHDLEKIYGMFASSYGFDDFFGRLTRRGVSRRFKRLKHIMIMGSIYLERSRLPPAAKQDLAKWIWDKCESFRIVWLRLLRKEYRLELHWIGMSRTQRTHTTSSFELGSDGILKHMIQ